MRYEVGPLDVRKAFTINIDICTQTLGCKVFTRIKPNGLGNFPLKWHQDVFPPKQQINVQLFGLKGWKSCIIVDQICWYILINLLELALKQHLNNDYFWDHKDDFQQTRLSFLFKIFWPILYNLKTHLN